ncbi:MAG: peptidylprolyl isomerase [Fimbriimonadaceae bacterium]|nr:peptidylprolyl isomerase [Fimbriimonadaceae bacterium]QOJ11725.1 MAG: peptidylprolyl isomerase [Chthonomonadaceae bacterium]
MKAMLLAILLMAAAIPQTAGDVPARYLAKRPGSSEILALIDGVPIRAGDVESLTWDWRAFEALQDLITFRLVTQRAKSMGMSVSEEQVEQEIEAQIARMKAQNPQATSTDRALLEQGFPKSRLYLRIKSQLLLDQIALSKFDRKAFVDVSSIIVPLAGSRPEDVEEARKLAEGAYQDLVAGNSWDLVLKRFQSDERILQSHGHIGWRQISAFPASASAELAKIAPGGITRPARTSNGFQIFRLDRRGDSAEGQVLEDLRNQYMQTARTQTLDELRKNARIEERFP